jgi:serine/threonine protein kinase/Tfp pilus assembly protein PilF
MLHRPPRLTLPPTGTNILDNRGRGLPLLGQTISHYRITKELGGGGMGVVYEAEDLTLGRRVALKFLPPGWSANPVALERFRREARSASALNHPNICTIYEIGESNGTQFLAMELLEGETLERRLARQRLSIQEVVEIASQVADALQCAHEKHILHRDIKPANIFLTAHDQVKLLDFGLAKFDKAALAETGARDSAAETSVTNIGDAVGTIAYMSPEQIFGKPLDARTDLFSFGIVLYEMATGVRPFRGDNNSVILDQITHATPTPPLRINPDVPPNLEEVILKALEKDRELRYQSAQEIGTDLRRLKRDSHSTQTAVVRPPRRRWPIAVGILLLLLVMAGAGAIYFAKRTPAEMNDRIESIAVLPLENLSHDPEQEYFSYGMTDALITDLSKISALRVISRTSVMGYKDTKKQIPDIARELNVQGIIVGAVQRSGNRVRITAQLVRASTDRNMWADSYEGDAQDVLALQGRVARAVADGVQVKLTAQDQQRLSSTRTVNPEAHELYLKGEYYLHALRSGQAVKAVDAFNQAIAIDPTYASAYEGLADAWYFSSNLLLPPLQAMPKVRAAATKALELDPSLSRAHTTLGLVYSGFEWNWTAAEKEFRKAVENNPGDAVAHAFLGDFLADMGRIDEGIRELRYARELDPRSDLVDHLLGLSMMFARDYDAAIEQFDRALARDPDTYLPRWTKAMAEYCRGNPEKALVLLRATNQLEYNPLADSQIAVVLIKLGKRAEAIAIVKGLEQKARTQHIPGETLVLPYFLLGRKEEAFTTLNKAYDDKAEDLVQFKVVPWYDPMRSDPRFQDFLKNKMKFPE